MALHYIDSGYAAADHADPGYALGRGSASTCPPDGRFLAYTLNEGGLSRLVLRDLRTEGRCAAATTATRRGDRRHCSSIAAATASPSRCRPPASPPETCSCTTSCRAMRPRCPPVALARWTQGELGGIDRGEAGARAAGGAFPPGTTTATAAASCRPSCTGPPRRDRIRCSSTSTAGRNRSSGRAGMPSASTWSASWATW